MEKSFVIDTMRTLVNRGFVWLSDQGIEWFESTMREVMKVSADVCKDKDLQSDFWTAIGDFYDILEAPRQSAVAYKKAVKLDRTNEYAEEELNNMEERVNDVLKLKSEKEKAQAESHELLAKGNYLKALSLIKKDNSREGLLIKAACFSAMGNSKQALRCWNRLLRGKTGFYLQQKDWFFLSSELWENPEFWKIQFKLKERTMGYFPSYESLTDEQGDIIEMEERKAIICKFHIARLEFDYNGLMELYKKHSEWKELRQAINEIAAPGASR